MSERDDDVATPIDDEAGARVGVDVGGTFTDLVAVRDDRLVVEKTPSTPDAPERAVGTATHAVADRVPPDAIDFFGHGTTVGTNAVLEGAWADVALVTSAGFRDAVAIGRQDRPSIYDPRTEKPDPVVPRDRRYGVPGRLDEHGETVTAVDDEAVRAVGREIAAGPAAAVAVCLLFSFTDDRQERRVAELLRAAGVDVPIVRSSAVLPELREYERSVATALNAGLVPVMETYLTRLATGLADRGVPSEPTVITSNGGLVAADDAADRPVTTLLSGPAAGVRGAAHVAADCGYDALVTMDMGGTSCDVAIVEEGEPVVSTETTVGEYPVAVPAVDVHTVGSGGGSIAWVDSGGALRVGPRSAGAEPGPVCYGRGGTEPTITDAHALRGRIDPARLVDDPADGEAIESAMATLAGAIDGDVDDAAAGVLRVAEASLERALRVVTVESGRDPRELTLVAFGGAGPLSAPAVAEALDVPRVLVPRAAGVLSALGLLASDVVYERSRSIVSPWEGLAPERVADVLAELAAEGERRLADAGVPVERRRIDCAAELRYAGQTHTVRTPVAGDLPLSPSVGAVGGGAGDGTPGNGTPGAGAEDADAEDADADDADAMDRVAAAFHDAHAERFGHADRVEPLALETLRVRAVGSVDAPALPRAPTGGSVADAVREHRAVGFGDGRPERRETPVYDRAGLPAGGAIDGPAIIEGPASTLCLPPGQRVTVDEAGHLLVEVSP